MQDPGRIASLGRREKECLRLVYDRRTTKEIAIELDLSPGTVSSYIRDAQAKLGARDRRQAAEWLHGVETCPSNSGATSEGMGARPPAAPTPAYRHLLNWVSRPPIRLEGAEHNDLTIAARLAWIVAIAIALALGFGMLAVGADMASNLWLRAFR